jgi:transposase-like protein
MAEKRLHGSARTTRDMRRVIRQSSGSIESMARELGINSKTVAKWRRRSSVEDAPMGTQTRGFLSLSREEEYVVLDFRKRTNLPLDECLYYLKKLVPSLTRSTLYRCFLKHGLSNIADHAVEMSDRDPFDLIQGYFRKATLLRVCSELRLSGRVQFLPK